MKKSRYLKIVGVLEIIATIISLIFCIIAMDKADIGFFVIIVVIAAIAFVAPAFGIALYTLGDLIETYEIRLREFKNDVSHNYIDIQNIKKEIPIIKADIKELKAAKKSDEDFIESLYKKIEQL